VIITLIGNRTFPVKSDHLHVYPVMRQYSCHIYWVLFSAGDRSHWSVHGSIQPRVFRFTFTVGKEGLQKVFSASSNEK